MLPWLIELVFVFEQPSFWKEDEYDQQRKQESCSPLYQSIVFNPISPAVIHRDENISMHNYQLTIINIQLAIVDYPSEAVDRQCSQHDAYRISE